MRRPVVFEAVPVPVVESARPSGRELNTPKIRARGGIPRNAMLLARGEITRDEYVRRTGTDYLALAKKLERCWRLPRAIETTDIVQELYLQTFVHVKKWDPRRAPIGRFLTFNAMSDTKKWLNEQRGAKSKGKEPSVEVESLDELSERGHAIPIEPTAPGLAMTRSVVQGQKDDVAECLIALLYEDSEADAIQTLIDNNTVATHAAARRLIASAKAQAMRVYAQ